MTWGASARAFSASVAASSTSRKERCFAVSSIPAIVANEGLAREPELERIDHQRKFGEHEVIPAHAETVHVRGSLDRKVRDDPLPAIVAYSAEPIETLHAKIDDVVVVTAPGRIVVRVRGRNLTFQGSAIAEHAERLQHLGLKAHGVRVSVKANISRAWSETLTQQLSVSLGLNSAATRPNGVRQGSVANSP